MRKKKGPRKGVLTRLTLDKRLLLDRIIDHEALKLGESGASLQDVMERLILEGAELRGIALPTPSEMATATAAELGTLASDSGTQHLVT